MKAAYGESFRARLRQQTLKDISGLDAAAVGFGRAECCGPIPKGLPGSTAMGQHLYYSTAVPPTQWEKRSENIPGCTAVQIRVARGLPHAGFTAFYDPDATATSAARLLRFDPPPKGQTGGTRFAEFSCALPRDEQADGEAAGTPWTDDAALSLLDRQCFVFVCSHLSRDARCGYCGPILADLLEQAVGGAKTGDAAADVCVYRCAHMGGHVYAGNVLVYNCHGAITYGLVTPDDVEVLASALLAKDKHIPASLQNRVRGKAGNFVAIQ